MEKKFSDDFQSLWNSLETIDTDKIDTFDEPEPQTHFLDIGPGTSIAYMARSPDLIRHNLVLGNTIGSLDSGFVPPVPEITIRVMKDCISRMSSKYGPEDFAQTFITIFPVRNNCITEYNSYFDQGEQFLYNTIKDVSLKNGISLGQTTQLFLNLIRVHRRIEDGDFVNAESILQILYNNLDEIPEKQTNTLFYCFINYLCTNQWDKSVQVIKRMWSIIKLMDNANRYNWGAWDDWFAVHIVLWFFVNHINKYALFLCDNMNMHIGSIIGGRKFLLVPKDKESIIDLISLSYYNKAKELNPELP